MLKKDFEKEIIPGSSQPSLHWTIVPWGKMQSCTVILPFPQGTGLATWTRKWLCYVIGSFEGNSKAQIPTQLPNQGQVLFSY